MTHEIWLADDDDKKVIFAGDKRSLQEGRLNEGRAAELAKFIAHSDGRTLRVTDGHEASFLVHSQEFTDIDR